MRIGIKIITMILRSGMSNAVSGATYSHAPGKRERYNAFILDVNRLVNCNIMGSEGNLGQWECPRDDKKFELGDINFENGRVRRIINDIDSFIALCIVEDGKPEKWKAAISYYQALIELLRKKSDFTNEQIDDFQLHVDSFFRLWVELCGQEGVTNYIHMLAAGHISEYLAHWRNLYAHSQQGWEAFNSLLKTFFFRRTGRGGAGNRGKGQKSKVIPIARWLSRRLIFICRISYDEIIASIEARDDPVIPAVVDEDDNLDYGTI